MAETENSQNPVTNAVGSTPGTVIAPGSASQPPMSAIPPPARPPAPLPPSTAPADPVAPTTTESPVIPKTTKEPDPADDAEPAEPANPQETAADQQVITWTASEFVAHDKTTGWYATLAIGALVLAALIFVVTRDAISVAVVVVAALLLGVFARHQPRQLEYRIDRRGVGIGNKYYGYDSFKSFSRVPEGAFSAIVFMPLKRFAPTTTIYLAPDEEERILAVLSDHLPFEEPRRDAVDNLMKRIRF